MNNCQRIMSEVNSALIKQRLGLSDQEYADLKSLDGNAEDLSSGDIDVVFVRAKAENKPAIALLEKFKSKNWYNYNFDEKLSPADLLCALNLARSKDLPTVSKTKAQEVSAFISAHHLIVVDLQLAAPNAADVFWQSMISYCTAGEAAFDNKTKELEEEKKRMATIDGLADILVDGLVELENMERNYILQKAADYFVTAPLEAKKKVYRSMKAIGIPPDTHKRLLMGMMSDVDDPEMVEWLNSLLNETLITADLLNSLQSSSEVSTYVKANDKGPKRLAQLEVLKTVVIKCYKNGDRASETVLLAAHKNDSNFFVEAAIRVETNKPEDILPDIYLVVDMFCAIANEAIRVRDFGEMEIEFETMKRLIYGRLRKIGWNDEVKKRLIIIMARLYYQFNLFEMSLQNQVLAGDIIVTAKNFCRSGIAVAECLKSIDYYDRHLLTDLYDKWYPWAQSQRRSQGKLGSQRKKPQEERPREKPQEIRPQQW